MKEALSEFVDFKSGGLIVDLFCLRLHSSMKCLLVSLVMPLARKVPGSCL